MRKALTLSVLLLAMTVTARAEPSYESIQDGAPQSFAEQVIVLDGIVRTPKAKWTKTDNTQEGFSDHTGRVLVATIWATWCHVCVDEMPKLDALSAAYKGRDLVVLPISVDTIDPLRRVERYLTKNALGNLPVLVDIGHDIAARIGVRGTPTTLFVDKFGQVTAAIEGAAAWDDPALIAYLDALLDAPDAETSRSILSP